MKKKDIKIKKYKKKINMIKFHLILFFWFHFNKRDKIRIDFIAFVFFFNKKSNYINLIMIMNLFCFVFMEDV